MRVFRTDGVKLFRSLKAFVRFEVGLARGPDLDPESLETRLRNLSQELQHTQKQLKRRTVQLEQVPPRRAERDRPVLQLEEEQDHIVQGITPGNIIWIFGSARTGSTWLSAMFGELEECTEWREPYVGALFGSFYDRAARSGASYSKFHSRPETILSEQYRGVWLRSVRSLVLEGARARFPKLTERGHLVIKEPNGSQGAPLLVEALPESRVILLVRDPRDAVASAIAVRRENGDYVKIKHKEVAELAKLYALKMGGAVTAYDAHRGQKVVIRYEDLRAATLEAMRSICSSIGLSVDDKQLSGAVERHAWENIPEEKKGAGRARYRARPGMWQEDLRPEQVQVVEEITASVLKRFYPS